VHVRVILERGDAFRYRPNPLKPGQVDIGFGILLSDSDAFLVEGTLTDGDTRWTARTDWLPAGAEPLPADELERLWPHIRLAFDSVRLVLGIRRP